MIKEKGGGKTEGSQIECLDEIAYACLEAEALGCILDEPQKAYGFKGKGRFLRLGT